MRRSLAVAARAAGRVTAGGGRLRSRAIPAPIVVTEAAKQRLQTLKANRPEALGVRVGVKTRGCNGMSYTINWVDEAPTASKFADSVDVEGIKVYIEPRALLTIIGTTMDFQSDEVREGFVFENPQATDVCGCGESFTLGGSKPTIDGKPPASGSGAPPAGASSSGAGGTPPAGMPPGAVGGAPPAGGIPPSAGGGTPPGATASAATAPPPPVVGAPAPAGAALWPSAPADAALWPAALAQQAVAAADRS